MMRTPGLAHVAFAPVVLHVVADTAVGIVVGVAIVAAYLAVLRWLDRNRGPDENGVTHSTDQRSKDP